MAADVVPYFRPQFLDGDAKPLVGGKVYTYKAGTTTPLATYRDAAYTPNTNPIILDSNGCADIFIGIQALKFVIHDANDVLIKTIDGVTGASGSTVGIQTVVPITTNGSQTRFALGVDAEIAQNCTVVVKPNSGSRITYMTSEYSIDGQDIVFSSAPPVGTGEVRVGHTRAIGSSGLSDGIVSTSKIQNLAVTNAKLAENSVGTSKIQDDSVTIEKIANNSVNTDELVNLSVTTAKLANGAVTQAKRAALGQQISSSSGSFTTAGATPVAVTNLSVSITTTGRPVMLLLIPGGGGDSRMGASTSTATVIIGFSIYFYRGGSEIGRHSCFMTAPSSSSIGITVPVSSTMMVDVPAAGTYTYSVRAGSSGSLDTMGLINAKLLAFEL